MWLDIIVLILVGLAAFRGLVNGFIIGVFSFIAFIVGLAAALKFSTLAAAYIGRATNLPGKIVPVLAFLSVFFIVVLLIKFGAKLIEKVVQFSMMGWLNRLGGILLYVLIYLFIFSIVLFYAVQLHIIKPETAQTSVTYPYLEPIAPKIINMVGIVLPFFKNMFTELLHFFQNVVDKPHPQQYTLWRVMQESTII